MMLHNPCPAPHNAAPSVQRMVIGKRCEFSVAQAAVVLLWVFGTALKPRFWATLARLAIHPAQGRWQGFNSIQTTIQRIGRSFSFYLLCMYWL